MSEFLKEGFYVYVNVLNNYYKIVSREPFHYVTGDEATPIFSSVAVGSESGWKNIDILEPDDRPKHLFQIRFGVKYGFKYYFKIPTGTARFGVDEDKNIGYIDNDISPYDEPNEDFEFWLVRDYYPSVNALNNALVPLTPKIYFRGMKYDIEEVTDIDILNKLRQGIIPCRYVTVGGIKTG